MPSDPVEQLRLVTDALEAANKASCVYDGLVACGVYQDRALRINFPALLTAIDRLQRIEAAAKVLTAAWQRGDHEQAIIDAVVKLTKEVDQ